MKVKFHDNDTTLSFLISARLQSGDLFKLATCKNFYKLVSSKLLREFKNYCCILYCNFFNHLSDCETDILNSLKFGRLSDLNMKSRQIAKHFGILYISIRDYKSKIIKDLKVRRIELYYDLLIKNGI